MTRSFSSRLLLHRHALRMPSTIEKICEFCNQNFNAPTRDVNRGRAKFCTVSCSSRFFAKIRISNRQNNVTCASCHKEFYKPLNKLAGSKSGLYFCTRACKDQAQRIGGIKEIQPAHYGATLKDYRDIAFRVHPKKCMRCGYDHHTAAIVVHHIDRDRENNSLENLEVLCCNCHAIEHLGESKTD